MAGMIVPPGGFSGMAQMTPASRAAWGGRATGTRKRKRSRTKTRARRSGKRKAAKSPKFGTAAFRAKYGNGKRKKSKKRR